MASGMTIDASGYIYVTGTTTSTANTIGSISSQHFALGPGIPEHSACVDPVFCDEGEYAHLAEREHRLFDVFRRRELRHHDAGRDRRRYCGRYQRERLLHRYDELHLHGMLGMRQYRLSHLERVPAVSGSGASGDDHRLPPTCSASTTTTEPDAFVAKLNLNPNVSAGQQLVWSTYLGGTGTDSGTGIAVDTGAANVYVVGTTNSTDIGTSATLATSAAFQRAWTLQPQRRARHAQRLSRPRRHPTMPLLRG